MLKLTIAIPAYNVAPWLEETLASILSCESDEYEILVVDDGSKDNTADIALGQCALHPEKVRYIYKENGHYGSVINRAVLEARGLFLRIVDGDDFVDAKGLEELLHAIDSNTTADLILCDYRRIYLLEHRTQVFKVDLNPGVYQVDEIDRIPDFGMHSAVFRTSLFVDNKIKLTEGVPYTDQQYVLYPMPYVRTIMYCPVEVYQYRVGVEGQSISEENAIKSIDAHRVVFTEVCRWVADFDITDLIPSVSDFIAFHAMKFATFHMSRAVLLKSEDARKELLMVDELIESAPLLKQNDCRGRLVKGFWLMKVGDYRLLPIWKVARRFYRSVKNFASWRGGTRPSLPSGTRAWASCGRSSSGRGTSGSRPGTTR